MAEYKSWIQLTNPCRNDITFAVSVAHYLYIGKTPIKADPRDFGLLYFTHITTQLNQPNPQRWICECFAFEGFSLFLLKNFSGVGQRG
jgi:hypothetical protein